MTEKKEVETLIKIATEKEYRVRTISYYLYKDDSILLVEANRENREYSFAIFHNTKKNNDYYKAKVYHSFSILSFRYPNTMRYVIVLDKMKRKEKKTVIKNSISNEVLVSLYISRDDNFKL